MITDWEINKVPAVRVGESDLNPDTTCTFFSTTRRDDRDDLMKARGLEQEVSTQYYVLSPVVVGTLFGDSGWLVIDLG